jgi:hypothetical protein
VRGVRGTLWQQERDQEQRMDLTFDGQGRLEQDMGPLAPYVEAFLHYGQEGAQ